MEIAIIWCTDDVYHLAQQRGISITEKEANEILLTMKREHDAELGITWDTIDYYLNELQRKKK